MNASSKQRLADTPALASSPPTLRKQSKLSVADKKVRAQVREKLDYADAVPLDTVAPVRSFEPLPQKPPESQKTPEPRRRRKTNADDELDMAWMGRAVLLMFAIEARLPPAVRRGALTSWPLALRTDRNLDYAPEVTRIRPSRTTPAEIQFRDDVMLLIARVAKTDALGARLVAHHALGVRWTELMKLDPARRQRSQLSKLRKVALMSMVKIERAEALRIIPRASEMHGANP